MLISLNNICSIDVKRGWSYGMMGKVKYIDGKTIFIKTANAVVSVLPVYRDGQEYYPIVAGCASTIHKVMG